MDTLPQFISPLSMENTNLEPVLQEDYTPLPSNINHSRPRPVTQLSTPPASPTTLKSSTMGVQGLGSKYDDGCITPPRTPTGTPHTSSSSDFLSPLSGLRRGDSVTSLAGSQLHSVGKRGSTELITFPTHSVDYEFHTDTNGRKKTIGEGAWSDVYLATPTLPKAPKDFSMTGLSPPLTPAHSREPSFVSSNTLTSPRLYAIKVPAMTSAKKVLGAEAKILSYLSRFPNAHEHIVPFFGIDTRTGSIVLKAMDGTLESWITNDLNTLPEPLRAKKLTEIFPIIALSLMNSLEWMQDKDCIQADIKPSNILIESTPSGVPQAVYTDFSSAILTKPGATIDSAASPLGAGTWDYLDPKLLSSSDPVPLSSSTELWSLAITLLYLVIGRSPYDAFKGNKYQQREMIKSGLPLQCLGHDDVGIVNMKRLSALSKDLCFDVQKWFKMVLVKDPASRANLKEWRGGLLDAVAAGTANIWDRGLIHVSGDL